MAPVHPQDTVDVPLAARRNAVYDCEFLLDGVQPVRWGVEKGQVTEAEVPQDPPLGRLAAAVESLLAVEAKFQLRLDDYGRPRMQGTAQATVVMPCQRCLEGVQIDVSAELGSVIWFGDEPPGDVAAARGDVILSTSSEMTYAALVEDDLLLALPQQVCQDDNCPRLPVLAFPAPGYTAAVETSSALGESGPGQPDAEEELADDRQRPFAGLRDLIDSQPDD